MSVYVMEIGHLAIGTILPSRNYEEPFGELEDILYIPSSVLWEQARSGITKVVQFSFKNVQTLLGQAEVELVKSEGDHMQIFSSHQLKLNSKILLGLFGRGRKIIFPNTVEVTLKHVKPVSEDQAAHQICVHWNYETSTWSNTGCSLAWSNITHSVCRCHHLTSFAVTTGAEGGPGVASSQAYIPVMALQIVTYIVPAISILCLVLILVKVIK